jgi:uncharacterized protein YegP (UPF0339 family)
MRFVPKKTSNGQFRFNLVASNGQTVATSETYTRKQSALDTIESIQKTPPAPPSMTRPRPRNTCSTQPPESEMTVLTDSRARRARHGTDGD